MPWRLKWWYGFRTLLNDWNIISFDKDKMRVSSAKIPVIESLRWENIGEDLDNKMAARIKTFLVAILFLLLCYIILYYPMLIALKARYKQEYFNEVKLTLLEKLVPLIASLLLVTLSIVYRLYMSDLGEKRNPKN